MMTTDVGFDQTAVSIKLGIQQAQLEQLVIQAVEYLPRPFSTNPFDEVADGGVVEHWFVDGKKAKPAEAGCLISQAFRRGVDWWRDSESGGLGNALQGDEPGAGVVVAPSLEELIPPDHPARFVAEFVDALGQDGWAELDMQMEGDSLGAPAYHPWQCSACGCTAS
jgi:hypothetical protein